MTQQTTRQTSINVGEATPFWTAPGNDGPVKLGDYIGKTAILLIFYPADWSNVCSDELPMLEELLNLIGDLPLRTFGISADSPACHKAFAHQVGLNTITLVSDYQHQISRLYGVLDEDGLSKRASILIDNEGRIGWVRVEASRDQPRPISEIEKAIQLVRQWNGYPGSLESWRKERSHIMQLQRATPLATPTRLNLRFWGTRGSIPVSGVNYVRYGGNTSCVSLTSDTGHLFIFDCGSGARELGNYLLSAHWPASSSRELEQRPPISGYILLSHTHWDHIQGFPFFVPVFQPGNHFHVIGWSNCAQTLAGIMAGQMEQIYFPVSLHQLPSELSFYSIQFGEAELDGATLKGRLLKHPLPSTAYRLELAGHTVVYATDHEPQSLPRIEPGVLLGDDAVDPTLVELARDADILIHDAQYSISELKEKAGWGHNSGVLAVDAALKAGVKTLVLYHHDPGHSDEDIDRLLEAARERAAQFPDHKLEVIAASDGLNIEL